MKGLKKCPFCGDIPEFSDVMEKDDNRYMQLDLQCCVTMSATLSWPYRRMHAVELKAHLMAELTTSWNSRYVDKSETITLWRPSNHKQAVWVQLPESSKADMMASLPPGMKLYDFVDVVIPPQEKESDGQ